VGWAGREFALAPRALDRERPAMSVVAEVLDVGFVRSKIAPENVIGGGAPPGAQAACGYTEHMFVA
jgi:hypothetical protein